MGHKITKHVSPHRVLHPSVRKLLQEYGKANALDAEAAIVEKARRLIEEAKSFGWTGPPFDPKVLASILDIKVEVGYLRDADAMILEQPNGQLLLQFDPRPSITRQNFSICHDIGHTLLPDFRETVHQRTANPREFDPDSQVEKLCDIAASEFLMPYDQFLHDMKALGGLSLSTMIPLRERYIASREAVIRRMIACTEEIAAAVFLKLAIKPSERNLSEKVPKFRIQYSVCSDRFTVYLPKHKSVPDGSCVYDAVSSGGIYVATEDWGIRGLGKIFVEALLLPSGNEDNRQAVALIKPLASHL